MPKSKALTVEELIKKLSSLKPSSRVVIEGCDCEGYCTDAVKFRKGEVLLRREQGVFGDAEDLKSYLKE